MHLFQPFLVWEGPYIDTWSIAHFIAGFLLVAVFIYFGFRRYSSFLGVVIVAALWEGVEQLIGTRVTETNLNSVMDVVCAAVGALLGYQIFISKLSRHDKIAIGIFAAAVFAIVCLLRILGA